MAEAFAMLTAACTPEPALVLRGEAESGLERELRHAWAHTPAKAMLLMVGEGMKTALDPSLEWLRRYAQRFMVRLCQARAAHSLPSQDDLTDGLTSLPPMQGAEYVTEALLTALWEQLATLVIHEAGDTLEAWLRAHGDVWHLVGRVTFHLAENKRDAERPFAFLATFTEKVSAAGKIQHLPLARALQRYAGLQDQAALNALLEPVRNAAAQSVLVKALLESRQLFQALAWTPGEAYELVREITLLQQCGIVMKVPDWWQGGQPSRPVVQVTIDAEQKETVGIGAMLSFKVAMSMDGEALTPEEIAKIKASTSSLITLRGKWVQIDREKLDQVLDHWTRVQQLHANGAMSFHEGMRWLSGMGAAGTADLQGFTDTSVQWSEVVAGKGLAEMLAQLRDPSEVRVPAGLKATLRPYQAKGLAWLLFMQRLGLGACLADDMGLGKTLQVIALLVAVKGSQSELKLELRTRPSLIVVPASLVGNWKAELAKFAPSLRVMTASKEAHDFEADVVIATYQFLTRSKALLAKEWKVVVLDEAQAIKNPGALQTQTVKTLRAQMRIALTGTPVENRPGDLWSLFDFLNPGLLGSAAAFAETIKRLGNRYAPLRQLVQPYLLRRMKTDKRIIADLPDKTEVKALCALTKKQATLYTRLVQELKRTLDDPSLPPLQRNGLVLSFLIKFKQVCNHPSHWSGDGQFKPEDSGKFARLAEICSELAERQERVLVFTQFAEMCEPLMQHLAQVFGRPGLMLNGSTPVKQRAQLVEKFQASDGPPFFVISVKAGGTGLTLTAASHVIHFDRWWNPAVENQATDRAFRIGQKKNVLVHKFIVPGTIEERVDRLMEGKQQLSDELLGGEAGAEKMLTDMSTEELLRFVALDVGAVV
jgi:superfamily II DNA or RNA helicase